MISFIGFKLPCESFTVTFNADNDLVASLGGAAKRDNQARNAVPAIEALIPLFANI